MHTRSTTQIILVVWFWDFNLFEVMICGQKKTTLQGQNNKDPNARWILGAQILRVWKGRIQTFVFLFLFAIEITNLQGNDTFGGGAEAHALFKHYGYRENYNLVLTTDSRPIPRERVGSLY